MTWRCSWAGLATHFVPERMLEDLRRSLQNTGDPDGINGILQSFAEDLPEAADIADLDAIRECFHCDDLLSVVSRVEARSKSGSDGEWAGKTLAALRYASPTSLAVAFEAFKRGSKLSLCSCLRMELGIATEMARDKNLRVGVSNRLVERSSKRPRWEPAELTPQLIAAARERYFATPAEIDFWSGDDVSPRRQSK